MTPPARRSPQPQKLLYRKSILWYHHAPPCYKPKTKLHTTKPKQPTSEISSGASICISMSTGIKVEKPGHIDGIRNLQKHTDLLQGNLLVKHRNSFKARAVIHNTLLNFRVNFQRDLPMEKNLWIYLQRKKPDFNIKIPRHAGF